VRGACSGARRPSSVLSGSGRSSRNVFFGRKLVSGFPVSTYVFARPSWPISKMSGEKVRSDAAPTRVTSLSAAANSSISPVVVSSVAVMRMQLAYSGYQRPRSKPPRMPR